MPLNRYASDDEGDADETPEEPVLSDFDKAKAAFFSILSIHEPEFALQLDDGIDAHKRVLLEVDFDRERYDCWLKVMVILGRSAEPPVERSFGTLVRRRYDMVFLNGAIVGAVLAKMSDSHRKALAEWIGSEGKDAYFSYIDRQHQWGLLPDAESNVQEICGRVMNPE